MADMASVDKALKIVTPYKELLTAWYDEQDFLKWVPTRTDFYGRKMEVPIGYGPGGGNSYNFLVAQAQSNRGRKYDNFNITRSSNYTIIYIDNEALEASEGGEDSSFLETYKAELEGGNVTNSQALAWDLWGDGSGKIGTVSAITSPGAGAKITLTDPQQIVRYEVGIQLDVYTSAGVIRPGTPGYLTVASVNEGDGTFTVDDSTYVTGLVATDYLVPRGNGAVAIKGVRSYVPFTDAELAANPTLWGMTRTDHPTRKAGRRYDGTKYTLAGALEMGLGYANRGGAFPEMFWVNNRYFTAISMEMGAKAVREFVKVGNFGFNTIQINSGGRTVNLAQDRNVPDGYAAGLKRNTWVWHTLKAAPRFLTPNAKFIIKQSADGIEIRWGWRGALVCRKPSDNLIVQMPALS